MGFWPYFLQAHRSVGGVSPFCLLGSPTIGTQITLFSWDFFLLHTQIITNYSNNFKIKAHQSLNYSTSSSNVFKSTNCKINHYKSGLLYNLSILPLSNPTIVMFWNHSQIIAIISRLRLINHSQIIAIISRLRLINHSQRIAIISRLRLINFVITAHHHLMSSNQPMAQSFIIIQRHCIICLYCLFLILP